MSSTRKFLDKLHPHFSKGGKFETLYPVYEMVDTFLYSPSDVTSGATHVRDAVDLKRVMTYVWIAALPCMLMAFLNTGYQANAAMQAMGLSEVPGWRGWVVNLFGHNPWNPLSDLVHGAMYFLPVYIVTHSVVAGSPRHFLRCGHRQGGVWRYRQEFSQPCPDGPRFPVFRLSGGHVRRLGMDRG